METADVSLIYLKIAKYKKAKKVLRWQYILYCLTFKIIKPTGLCWILRDIFTKDFIKYEDFANRSNAIFYCNGRKGSVYWWKHPYDGDAEYDYKNRKTFLDWCISELEKKLK